MVATASREWSTKERSHVSCTFVCTVPANLIFVTWHKYQPLPSCIEDVLRHVHDAKSEGTWHIQKRRGVFQLGSCLPPSSMSSRLLPYPPMHLTINLSSGRSWTSPARRYLMSLTPAMASYLHKPLVNQPPD